VKRTWRFWLGLWAGKFAAKVLRILGKQGTTFPGYVASRIAPELLPVLSAAYPEGVIIVTGTNGKTTTANLLAQVLKSDGKTFAFNQAGANMLAGITGALIADATWTGKPKGKLALFEVDEGTVPKLCQWVTPRLAVVTNFFRDQLDRYGELDKAVKLVREALTEKTELVLNADDPLVAQFGWGRERAGNVVFYGVDSTPISTPESRETREARFCPQCGQVLEYSLYHYGQLGLYSCRHCGFHRPTPHVLATEAGTEKGNIVFKVDGTTYKTLLQGHYNLYNALAAVSAAKRLGIREEVIAQGLKSFLPQAGRMERFNLAEGEVTLTLVKNPTGFNQVLQALVSEKGRKRMLIAINDLAADGRDISWLWDVDFELFNRPEIDVERIICSGLRAEDVALRLKYAGIPVSKLAVQHDLDKALTQLQAGRAREDQVFILPSYTALFPMRDLLSKRRVEGTLPAAAFTGKAQERGRA